MPDERIAEMATPSIELESIRYRVSDFAAFAKTPESENSVQLAADRFNTPAWDYFRWFYARKLWKSMTWRGIRTLKFPPDMWNYQEIIAEHGIEYVIETGTRHGGSALFFSDHVKSVVTIDPNPDWQFDWRKCKRIQAIETSSIAPGVAELAVEWNPGKRMVILDSLHSAAHVEAELQAFVPLLAPGDYVVVEDTVIDALAIGQNGPLRGLEAFLASGGPLKPDTLRGEKFGCSAAVDGYYIRV